MRRSLGFLLFLLFVGCSDDDGLSLNRNYFVGLWEVEASNLMFANQTTTYQLNADGTCVLSPRFGTTNGRWSYRDTSQDLLIMGSGGLITYEILNYSANRFEALSSPDESIVFFERTK